MTERYLHFVSERHQIWLRRQRGDDWPWTVDPVLASKKFTNVYRVLDYGTQFLLKYLWDPWAEDPVDNLYRFFMYRHTGRWEAWQLFKLVEGRFPEPGEPDNVFYLLDKYRAFGGNSVFTNAYLVFPQSQQKGTDKLRSIIDLTERLYRDGTFKKYTRLGNLEDRVNLLREQRGVGDFMAMQISTDWGYIWGGNEDEFILAGPGARKGTALVAPGEKPEAVIYWFRNILNNRLLQMGLEPVELEVAPGVFREPSLMDIQNTFCEFQKYVRYSEKAVPSSPYKPAHPGLQPAPMFPSEWGER